MCNVIDGCFVATLQNKNVFSRVLCQQFFVTSQIIPISFSENSHSIVLVIYSESERERGCGKELGSGAPSLQGDHSITFYFNRVQVNRKRMSGVILREVAGIRYLLGQLFLPRLLQPFWISVISRFSNILTTKSFMTHSLKHRHSFCGEQSLKRGQ